MNSSPWFLEKSSCEQKKENNIMKTMGFWKNKENCIEYIKCLGEKLKYKEPSDWYKLSTMDVIKFGGKAMFVYYKIQDLPKLIYPNYDWKPWLFKTCYWNKETIINYLTWLGTKLGYKEKEDWYQVSQKDFRFNKGLGLLTNFYNSSVSKILKDNIDNTWYEWLFKGGVVNNFWKSHENRVRYMKWLETKLNYKKIDDWYEIQKIDFENNKGSGLLSTIYNSSPAKAVMDCFPDHNWEIEKFYTGMRKQKILFSIIKKWFPDKDVIWNYKHPQLKFSQSSRNMEIDIFIPALNLAIEFQGIQHFLPKWGTKELISIQKRDEEKRINCKKNNIKLVEIDYTWNGNENTLIKDLWEVHPHS
jgi:hypothetical protein